VSIVTAVSTAASIGANILPKAEILAPYPRVQKFYQVSVAFVAALAFNIRHQLPSLDLSVPGFRKPPAS
jgi:hypothetical protein